VPAALRGYRKLTRLAASVTATRCILFLACCSHNVAEAEFAEAVRRGLGGAGRGARILRIAGADADHPIHPALPETAGRVVDPPPLQFDPEPAADLVGGDGLDRTMIGCPPQRLLTRVEFERGG